jgi:hypothetical protein
LSFLQDTDASFGTDDSTAMHQPQLCDLEAGRPGGSSGLQASPKINRSTAHLSAGPNYLPHGFILTDADCETTSLSLNTEITALKHSIRNMTRSGQRIKGILQEMKCLPQVEESEIMGALIDSVIKMAEVLVSDGECHRDGICQD